MVQLVYIITSLHVLLCPFTKVEESFNIQASHDILYHRHNLSQYDHNEFPGVVPRTFLGSLIISGVSAPIVGLLHISGINKFWMQYVVRLTLALSVIAAWSRVKNALQKQFGNTYTWWYTIITVTQYHFMFYMSRPLPNIMALPLVLLAFEGWLSGKHKQFLVSAGAGIVIFRSELAMLFCLFLIMDLYFKKIDMRTLLKIVIPAGIGLVSLTVLVDSIFWGRVLWPEAEVFWYNTILNKSANWGTSPFLWYFYSALPRGLGPSLILIPVGVYLDRRVVPMVAPAFVYILLYSFLPHKELRFIIYVFPLLNMSSAAACSYIYIRRTKAPIYELLFWGQIIVVLGNIAITLTLVLVAMNNYPGGVAISRLHKLLKHEPFVHVHISNLAAQTGVTRFTEIHSHWKYSKNESLEPLQMQEYTHLIVEAKSKYSPAIKIFSQTHDVLESIDAFTQIALNYKLIPLVKIKTRPALFILQRKDFRDHPYGHITVNNESLEFSESIQIMAGESPAIIANDDIEEDDTKDSLVIDEIEEGNDLEDNEETFIKDNSVPDDNTVVQDNIVQDIEDETVPIITKAKKSLEELKTLRQERKEKAIEKIKLETRKEVVASAKEKLKEIMNRHKHIAAELSENIILDKTQAEDVRGDIPELKTETPELEVEKSEVDSKPQEIEQFENILQINETTSENIDAIVEEVIVRLIDRKIYDDKTKPEDIKAEDRQMIQKIVEEVLLERMNYSNPNM